MRHELTLAGELVRLEPLRPEHAEELAGVVAPDDDVWAHMRASPRTPREMEAWISERIEGTPRGAAYAFLQRAVATGAAMGSTSLFDVDLAEACGEIGHTWLAAPFRRTGVNVEAKLLLLEHAFETLGLVRVQLVTDERNLRSQRAIERLPAVREGTLRRHRRDGRGELRHSVYFSILREEWPVVREALRSRLRRGAEPQER